MKRITLSILFVLCNVLLLAQRQYDYYDDSAVAGGTERALNVIIIIGLIVIGVLVFVLIGGGYYKIKYWFNPEESPEYKAAQKRKEIEEQRLKEEIIEVQRQTVIQKEEKKDKKEVEEVEEDGFTMSSCGTRLIKCSDVEECHIPYGVKIVAKEAFKDAKSIRTLYIPNSVEEIEDFAFSQLTIETVYIPKSINKWGECAFRYCTMLKNVIIEDGLSKLGISMFEGCKSIETIIIPDSITSLPDSVFEDCENLENVKLPSNLTNIGESAFYSCKKLKSIVIPHSVIGIQDDTFAYCENLSNVTIPEGVVAISSHSFDVCMRITNLRLPATIQHIDTDCFGNFCYITIEVPKGTASYYRELNIEGVTNIVEYETQIPNNKDELKAKSEDFLKFQNYKREYKRKQSDDFEKPFLFDKDDF